jgi:hypothetical protein
MWRSFAARSKPCALGDQSVGKIGVVEKTFGALDAQRSSDLQWRGMKMLGKEPR